MLVGHSRFFRGFMQRVLDMKRDEIGEHSGSDDMGGDLRLDSGAAAYSRHE